MEIYYELGVGICCRMTLEV